MARFGLSMFRRVRRFQFRCFARKRFGKQETKSFGRFLLSGQSPANAAQSENTTAIDWRRESPLLQHVQLGDVVFIVQPRSAAAAKDNAFANLGYEILAQGPRGPLIVERIDGRGQLTGIPAPLAGDYTITDGTAPPRHLSPAETSLAAVTQIEFADQLTVAASTTVPKADRSLWWVLACTGFVVLLVEWWWFQRRPGIA